MAERAVGEAPQEEVIEFMRTAKAYTTRYLGEHWASAVCTCDKHKDRAANGPGADGLSGSKKQQAPPQPQQQPCMKSRQRRRSWQEEDVEATDKLLASLTDKDVSQITTHSAHVFLVGNRLAFKLERAVSFPFMDMSTFELRRVATVKELCLNRITSPEIYLGLVAVCRNAKGELFLVPVCEDFGADTTLTLAEEANQRAAGQSQLDIVDYLVEMRQFRQQDVLDEVAKRGHLTRQVMEEVVDQTVLFHHHARVHKEPEVGSKNMLWVAADNLKEMREFASDKAKHLDYKLADEVCRKCVQHTERLATVMDKRLASGKVRFCHGDLHLKNMVLLPDGHPRLFDCIEFNDQLAIGDVMYDFSFLLMDLLHRGLRSLACTTLSRYIEKTHDIEGLGLLPLFLANRAVIRAKVSCAEMASHQGDEDALVHLQHRATSYLKLAREILHVREACECVAIAGFSGSGKTAVARLLACKLPGFIGGIVLRSDVVRKHMWNVGLLDRLPEKAYTAENRMRCYREMATLAKEVEALGFPVVLDATYTSEEQRKTLDLAPNCQRVWLSADLETRAARIAKRQQSSSDASDMTVEKLHKQEGTEPPKDEWIYVDATQDLDAVVKQVAQAVTDVVE